MKNSVKIGLAFLVIPTLFLLESCQKEDVTSISSGSSVDSNVVLKSKNLNTFYGPAIPIGNGVGRAWVSVNMQGDPTAVGINLSEKALEKLPEEATQFVLDFPDGKGGNFYKHALVDWNPDGHEPPGVYDLPHFDFHFYIISNEARMAIGPDDQAQFANAPADEYLPPAYFQIPGGVPQMGAHWGDGLSPEFNGGVFTKTFIWGSYDGSFIFWEPMITRAYLLTHPDELIAVRQPQAFEKDGWYATNYKISYTMNPNQYTIALTGLNFHAGE
jgi:hypothetical protein